MLVALRDLYHFKVNLYFDNDFKNDKNLNPKEYYDEDRATEDIINFAKS